MQYIKISGTPLRNVFFNDYLQTHLISSKSLQKHQLQTTLMAQRPDVQDLEKTEKNDPCPDTYLPPGKKYKMVDIPYSEKIMTFCGCNRNQRLKSFPTYVQR